MAKNYGMVIDVAKCTGCYACFLACKDENANEEHPGYTAAAPMTGQHWINLIEVERGSGTKIKLAHVPVMCAHCDNPACLKAAQDGAVYKREDGIVIIDPVKAVGQKELVASCPYRMIWWNEEKQLAQKCDLCAHLLDDPNYKNKQPRCVEMCPTSALTFGDLNDPKSEVAKLVAEKKPTAKHAEFGLKDRVLYLNIPQKFVAGAVVCKDTDQCCEGATVKLTGEGVSKTVTTDEFGDFWFEELKSMTDYTVEIAAAGYQPVTIKTKTYSDVNLGDIFLAKKA